MRLLVCHREVGSHRERKRKPKAPEKNTSGLWPVSGGKRHRRRKNKNYNSLLFLRF